MSALDLRDVAPGFAEPVSGSQRAFRGCLEALARPGTLVEVGAGLEGLPGVHSAATALLLALLDQDTRLWLSPALAPAVAASLRFHTGCALVEEAQAADFVLAASPAERPPLDSLELGTDEQPHRSASVIVQVGALAGPAWRLDGPGIREERALPAPDLGAGFLGEWERNRARFPRGVDLFLACGERLCGLPRGTRIRAQQPSGREDRTPPPSRERPCTSL
jgi:alpha-D-ribose 1-methylphosphonate 5-triphosphate synthase subunit PhnH